MQQIKSFTGKYQFLSNFARVDIIFDGETYSSVEHAYQAAKTQNSLQRAAIRKQILPSAAKRLGRRVTLRPDWECIKFDVMWQLLVQKFAVLEFAERLNATGDAELIEGNAWGDTVWGVCGDRGENHLGRLLMEVRSQIRRKPNTCSFADECKRVGCPECQQ